MGSVSWMIGEGGMPAYTSSKAAILVWLDPLLEI